MHVASSLVPTAGAATDDAAAASYSLSSWEDIVIAAADDGFPALNALFNNSYVAVPAITVNATANLQLELVDVYCGNLYIDDLATQAYNVPALQFSLDLVTASLDCHGRWSYLLDGRRYEPGTFRADASGVNFQLAASAPLDPKYHLPGNFTVGTCDFTSKIYTSFKGQVDAWILDLLRPLADAALDEALHKELCVAARPAIADALSNLTTAAADVLVPFLDDPSAPVVPRAPPTPAPAPGTVVNWAAVPLLSEVLAGVNAMGPDTLNGLVAIITGGTGELDNLPLLGNLTLRSATTLANSTLELQAVSVGGLDTLTAFDVLDPEKRRDNSTVDTKLGFGKLTLVVRAELKLWRGSGLAPTPTPSVDTHAADYDSQDQDDVNYGGDAGTPHPEPPLATQLLDLSFNLTNATLAIDLWAPLRTSAADGLGSLLLGHLTNVQCWLSKMDGLEVLLLAPTAAALEGPAIVQVVGRSRSGGASDLWSGLEDILEHVEAAYYPALVSVLPLVANGPLATALNGLLNESLAGSAAACAAHPLDPPG